ncbi:cation:proton antiporter subunit C [Alphaproteobacteria bacterium]|jgi:multicomponent Na+:H+ antiporter subunit C|nr:cation:proton antiporter subunit C [Alphaproteobacteria bacterium]MDC0594474.1 cation:proton antiporter subunit C [Alphaproteobacteria bacterium]MDC0967811.1 cation:proton antiporter subunit C [Alphaproteobacteria bacterium]|tara:strand:- start:1744 stop:2106 length:363 start_codon:yes stop_codon:yes gene_type:complete
MNNFLYFWNHFAFVLLMVGGLFIIIVSQNYIKKIVGLAIFQTSVFVFFVSLAKIIDGTAPILNSINTIYSNPLPHVLILTAIVVGVATSALGLAIVLQIYRNYGTIEENEIKKEELKDIS